jgi:N-acyl amino acid synthase of PEP-CTERM/exosortase system
MVVRTDDMPRQDPDDPPLEYYFSTRRVTDPILIRLCQSLRYQVYCKERSFLDPHQYPDQIEYDEFDQIAWHFATIARRSLELAGTVRIVPYTRSLGLPISQHCEIWPRYDPARLLRNDRELGKIAEISRLAISRAFRRRQFDDFYGDTKLAKSTAAGNGILSHERRAPSRPLIVLGLYGAYYRECKHQGIERWYAAMEPALTRLLARFGIKMTRVGPDTDYYGNVAPYSASIHDMETTLAEQNPKLLQEFATGLEPHLLPETLRSNQSR